jgi:hypothetical protein
MLKNLDLLGKKDGLALNELLTQPEPIIEDSKSESPCPLSASNGSDTLNVEEKSFFTVRLDSESNLLHSICQTHEDIFSFEYPAQNFLQKKQKRSNRIDTKKEDSDKNKNSMGEMNNEENNNQGISINNFGEAFLSKEENELQKRCEGNLSLKNNTFQVSGPNDIKNSKNNGSERGKDKDNISINLFTKLNQWILKRLNSNSNEKKKKIHTPNYKIFTHDTNLVNIYVFLDIKYKNFLFMTQKDKKALNQLLIDLKIKKKFKKIETNLTEK